MIEVDKTINNSFEQELIDKGYKIFKDNWKNAIRGFQKKFTDEKGIRYFIKRSVKPTDAVGSVGCKRPLTL